MAWLALALVAVVALVLWHVEEVLAPLADRALTAWERRVALAEQTAAPPPKREPLPPDLEAIAARETEAWAREQVRSAFQDEYEQTQDWDTVRSRTLGADA